ncbi:MAG: hypothetical protein AAF939_21685 [Planctomycetota bacterium]
MGTQRIVFFCTGLVITLLVANAHAQSGSRGGFGGLPRNAGTRPSKPAPLTPEQIALLKEQAEEALRQQAIAARQRQKQTLAQLILPKNQSTNAKQYRAAYTQARRDYASLIKKKIAPGDLGALKQLFRLTGKDINRAKHTANWPTALQKDEFAETVKGIDMSIMDSEIKDKATAEAFLVKLNQLNLELNELAAAGGLDSQQFAKARRFITGLANEVHASNLVE